MGNLLSQRRAFNFLREHLLSGEPFLLKDFVQSAGWTKPGTYKTYFQKQFRGLIQPIDGSPFRVDLNLNCRVTEAFRKYLDWRKFRSLVTQVRNQASSYEVITSEVLIYEFLMPLTHESSLRMMLDSLFHKDTLISKLKLIDRREVENYFDSVKGKNGEEYLEEILRFIEKNFVGYSIYHVDGRFRATSIMGFDEIAGQSKRGGKYLIDETTAVTRFIFPWKNEPQLKAIRFLFDQLFVKGMIELVEGEQEIWMIENAPKPIVRIWRAEDSGASEDDDDDDEL
jgi:hypothetical protein